MLASLSTSSTASTFVAAVNNLQSKLVMALVYLSSVAAFFFYGNVKLIKHCENAYDRIVSPAFCLTKSPVCVSAMVHTSMRDKTCPVQVTFSDSLWALIRRSCTKYRPKNSRPRGKQKCSLEN